MVNKTTIVTGAAALVTAGSLAFAGASLASADETSDTGESGTTSQGSRGGHEHTEVTGDEATRVTDAVTAQDSAITVESVRKDPDGSYDVLGTKDGSRVMVQVSADLATIEVGSGGRGGPGGGRGPGGMGDLTEATEEETTQVTEAVTAQDSGFTVEEVRKTTEGDFMVRGTKDGERAMARVSADLQTVEVRTGGPRGGGKSSGGPSSTESSEESPTDGASTAPAVVPSTGTSATDVPTQTT